MRKYAEAMHGAGALPGKRKGMRTTYWYLSSAPCDPVDGNSHPQLRLNRKPVYPGEFLGGHI